MTSGLTKKNVPPVWREHWYNAKVSKKSNGAQNPLLLTVPAAGEEPEMKTDKTDLSKRIMLKEGL